MILSRKAQVTIVLVTWTVTTLAAVFVAAEAERIKRFARRAVRWSSS